VNRGCQFDLIDKSKKTPIHFAKAAKHHQVIEYFSNLKENNKKPKEYKEKES